MDFSDDAASSEAREPEADREVDPNDLPGVLYRLLTLHGLTTHHSLRLLSLNELGELAGLGPEYFRELKCYCLRQSIEQRSPNVSIAARAVTLYGSILSAPAAVALTGAFPKLLYSKIRRNEIGQAVHNTGVNTIGELVEFLTRQPEIPDLQFHEHAALRDWLGVHIFYR